MIGCVAYRYEGKRLDYNERTSAVANQRGEMRPAQDFSDIGGNSHAASRDDATPRANSGTETKPPVISLSLTAVSISGSRWP